MTFTFKQFLSEAVVNFDTKDISTTGKQRGREVVLKAAGLTMQDFNKMKSFFKKATTASVMGDYNSFVDAFPKAAAAINALKPDGVGPGEMIMYFVFDNVGVGGRNSAIDIYVDGKEFAETKAGQTRGNNEITNFKITKDGDEAVTQLMKDLSKFNDKYEEITGESLPNWKGAGGVTPNSIKNWKQIDLKVLALKTTGGSKKSIDLVLRKDGDLLRKGEQQPILNVTTSKNISPIKNLLSANVAVDNDISSLDKIIDRWVKLSHANYIEGKKFILIDTKSLTMKFFGNISQDMLGLYYTNRNQPWAVVNLEPASKSKSLDKVKK